MSGQHIFAQGLAEISQDGKLGQASVDLSAPGGSVSVDASAVMGAPPSVSGLEQPDLMGGGWSLIKS